MMSATTSKHGVLIDDDEEIIQCEYGKCHLKEYHNTSSCHTSPSSKLSPYTQTLMQYGHLNCAKCGVYVPIHPDDADEAGVIFVCSAETPHPHCLCYQCGELYQITKSPDDDEQDEEEEEKSSIVGHLMADDVTTSTESSVIGSDAMSTTLLAANGLATMNMANNGTFIAEMMSNYEEAMSESFDLNGNSNDALTDHDANNAGAVQSLFLSTIFAVIVWQGMVYAPELLRVSAITVWFLCFYFLISLYFTDNESVQDTVFTLLSFAPAVGALGVFAKTRKMHEMQEDARLSIQFLSVFGGAAYFWSYCSVLAVYEDMLMLSQLQRIIALFIAVSVLGFMLLLLKNCNFMWYGLRRECTDHDVAHQHIQDPHPTEMVVDLDLKTSPVINPLSVITVDIEHEMVSEVQSRTESKNKKRRRRRRKRNGKSMKSN